ncbi:DotI/IcmL/TraM family protein [Massilia orientalis]|uniref:DotI/IcmL/TraM family protein n=1 Tax=Massilia orientalis TaxID=3050128 RepID=A0ACC7MEC3_9BURK|nr:DotI/IcmL/TraM family protein [Massilia sp. YIM B02787]
MSTQQEAADLFGIDLHAEVTRLRALNGKLAGGIVIAALAGTIGIIAGIVGMTHKPERERIALDAAGRAYPVMPLTKGDPPDARITRMAGDCMNSLFNHAFHNYQTTVERAIGECFTGGGSESVRKVMEPFLEKMKKDDVNLASSFVIQPFINARGVMGSGASARNVFHIQGVIDIGYRGGKANTTSRPVSYAFQTDVVRVSYDSHIEGMRLQNVVLVPWQP